MKILEKSNRINLKDIFVFSLFCLISYTMFGQAKNIGYGSEFKFYYLSDRYNEMTLKFFEDNDFINSKLLTRSMIDPTKVGRVDLKTLKLNIERLFPEKQQKGVCFIDWEEPYRMMKSNYDNQEEFESLLKEYEIIINLIRELRPNVEISVYGIPFVTYSMKSEVLEVNKENRFDPILSIIDFISPSLYIRFPNKEVGEKGGAAFINNNLDISFQYASRLKKPVVPFMWSYVHPNNKKYGMELMSHKEIIFHLENILTYEYKGRKVAGIAWYDTNITSSQREKRNQLDDFLKNRENLIVRIFNEILTN